MEGKLPHQFVALFTETDIHGALRVAVTGQRSVPGILWVEDKTQKSCVK
jgi:hypothetical protein